MTVRDDGSCFRSIHLLAARTEIPRDTSKTHLASISNLGKHLFVVRRLRCARKVQWISDTCGRPRNNTTASRAKCGKGPRRVHLRVGRRALAKRTLVLLNIAHTIQQLTRLFKPPPRSFYILTHAEVISSDFTRGELECHSNLFDLEVMLKTKLTETISKQREMLGAKVIASKGAGMKLWDRKTHPESTLVRLGSSSNVSSRDKPLFLPHAGGGASPTLIPHPLPSCDSSSDDRVAVWETGYVEAGYINSPVAGVEV